MGGSSNKYHPIMPAFPAPPEAPDMTGSFDLAIQNQKQQNEISDRQAQIAEGQLTIAEDRYGLSKQYRPLQEKALKDAVRGQDPQKAEALARADVMQRVTPAHEGLSRAAQRSSGMKPDSPNVMAGHEQLAAGLAGAQGSLQAETYGKSSLQNIQEKLDAVGSGRDIPHSAVRGMSTAAGVMGAGARTADQAANNYMRVLASGEQASYSAAVSQWQYESSLLQRQFEMDMQLASENAGNGNSWMTGAMAGGMIGMRFGPWGAVIGAVVGGLAGYAYDEWGN